MSIVKLAAVVTASVSAGYLLRLLQENDPAGRREPRSRFTSSQLEAMHPDAQPPKGYGALLRPDAKTKPAWLDDGEIVARHLPMGLSERKAEFVTTWDHAFRLLEDHPRYAGN